MLFGHEKTDYIWLYKTAAGLRGAADEIELVKFFGVDGHLLYGDQIRRVETEIRNDVLGRISYPEDSYVVSGRPVRGMAEQLAQPGGQVLQELEFDQPLGL